MNEEASSTSPWQKAQLHAGLVLSVLSVLSVLPVLPVLPVLSVLSVRLEVGPGPAGGRKVSVVSFHRLPPVGPGSAGRLLSTR